MEPDLYCDTEWGGERGEDGKNDSTSQKTGAQRVGIGAERALCCSGSRDVPIALGGV